VEEGDAGAQIEFDEAQAIAARFIDPALADAVAGRCWSAADQRWG
jgi:hypothetical protein